MRRRKRRCHLKVKQIAEEDGAVPKVFVLLSCDLKSKSVTDMPELLVAGVLVSLRR